MSDYETDPVDLSAEAVLELEEFHQGLRSNAPALAELFHRLRTPQPAPSFQGQTSISMLDDVRSYSLFRDSLGTATPPSADFSAFKKFVEKYLSELEKGVAAGKPEKVEEAKRFCLAFNDNLMSRRMAEIYERRERADSRYVSNESLS